MPIPSCLAANVSQLPFKATQITVSFLEVYYFFTSRYIGNVNLKLEKNLLPRT